MKYVAICFTDKKYERTRKRYEEQLLSKNIFDQVIAYKPEDIDEEFIQHHKIFIDNNPKGYGYYIWKPYIILKTLMLMDDGDILVYGDAGNDMPGSREDCLKLFNQVSAPSNGANIIAAKQGWNIRWIKADLYKTMGLKTFLYALKPMSEAARIVFQKNETTMRFVSEWVGYATSGYHNIDNTASRIPNLPFFIEHRWDQSIFSILFQKYNCTLVNFGETWRAARLRF